MSAAISVIIPTFFEEKTLRRLLSQFSPQLCTTYRLELIISDGGSTDRTLEIAESFAATLPLRIVRHRGKHRQTIAEGRNQGAAIAQGETLVFLNSDVVLADPPQFFATVTQWAGEEPQRSVALVPKVFVFPADASFKDRLIHTIFNRYIQLLNAIGIGACRGEAQIIRTRTFREVGGYNAALAAGEDFELYQRLAKIGKIRYCPNLIVYEDPRRYRQYGYLRTFYLWSLNTLSIWIRNRAVTQEWTPVR